MLKLVISDNEGTTTVVPFARDEISIGRKDGNTIRLTERNISRKHCTLERLNGSYRVRDHGSYNGVIVNGARIEGEAPLAVGDKLRIGDYTVLVETDAPAVTSSSPPPPPPPARSSTSAADKIESEPTRVAPLPKAPTSPARLVVLTAPLAGAEFTLPERGELRLGRAEELEVTIDHRSVSREHARLVCEAGKVRLVDRGSSNGVLVNSEPVTDVALSGGDVIELGEVLVRFVGPGETFVFDPLEAEKLVRARRGGSRAAIAIAGGIVGVAIVAAFMIVRSSGDDVGEPIASAVAIEATPSSDVSEDQRFGELLGACRAALTGGRFAESMAHAQQALKLRPASSEAAACHTQARAQHDQEQAFVRAKAAYEKGDVAAAQGELELLIPGTPLASRPDVGQLVQSVGDARVAEAEMLVTRDAARAEGIARGALRMPMLASAHRQRAEAVLTRAQAAASAQATAPEKGRDGPAVRSPSRPRSTPSAASAGSSPSPTKSTQDTRPPIEVASACLARGDNACVIRALQGKAQSAQELGLLIETYRAMGNAAQAQKNMTLYVQRFPTARRAETYRIMLQRSHP